MSERVIPLIDQRALSQATAQVASIVARAPALPIAATGLLGDTLGRPLRDLRISVTDRCNFRCSYCMPKEVFDKDYQYLPHNALLSFEEIARVARVFAAHGVQKIRLTGGEPLLRKNIEVLIEMLSRITTADSKPLDITLTTNASLLRRKAQALKAAGLQRVTISLDGLHDATFRAMNDVDFPVADVLDGIAAAQEAGLQNIKVNMVVKRGTNAQEILPMARYFQGTGTTLRFIEYMDVGATNGWRMDDVMPSAQVIQHIHAHLPLVQLEPSAPGETAQRWGYAGADGLHDASLGEIGVISSVTQAFCGDCNRARLSTEGKLYTCLFATQGHDLRTLLRGGTDRVDVKTDDTDLTSAIGHIWQGRSDRYSELRASMPADHSMAAAAGQRRVEMSYIGG
jgi:GTP 3',8-cyclase